MAASFTTAFGDAELWLDASYRGWPLLAFVGFRGRSGDGVAEVGGARRVCGAELLREWSAGAPRNTDDRPFIEYSAAETHLAPVAVRRRAVSEAVDWLRSEEHRRSGGAPPALRD